MNQEGRGKLTLYRLLRQLSMTTPHHKKGLPYIDREEGSILVHIKRGFFDTIRPHESFSHICYGSPFMIIATHNQTVAPLIS